MMVNIRKTAIPISLTSALIPRSQRPGSLRLVSLCRLPQQSAKVIFHSHIASHDKILSCYYFFYLCVSRQERFYTHTCCHLVEISMQKKTNTLTPLTSVGSSVAIDTVLSKENQ